MMQATCSVVNTYLHNSDQGIFMRTGIINLDVGGDSKEKLIAMADEERRTQTTILQTLIDEAWEKHPANPDAEPEDETCTG